MSASTNAFLFMVVIDYKDVRIDLSSLDPDEHILPHLLAEDHEESPELLAKNYKESPQGSPSRSKCVKIYEEHFLAKKDEISSKESQLRRRYMNNDEESPDLLAKNYKISSKESSQGSLLRSKCVKIYEEHF